MVRVVIDASVMVSALIDKNGKPRRLLSRLLSQRAVVSSEESSMS
jgi:predicted nucleic acid-binding protein